MTSPLRIDQRVYTNSYLIDLPAPVEELLTVAIDDTANTVFHTGIARIFCHRCTFTIPAVYIHEIIKGTADNRGVIHMILEMGGVGICSLLENQVFYSLPKQLWDLDRHPIKFCNYSFFLKYNDSK
jgi:hypothetical protein